MTSLCFSLLTQYPRLIVSLYAVFQLEVETKLIYDYGFHTAD